MPKFRIRYQQSDLELPLGEFVVGRSRECNLAVDDALVSRRHAIFHVSDSSVVLEDLGSRNGTKLNGKKIAGKVPLEHLAFVVIGTQELVLLEDGRRTGPPEGETNCLQCGTSMSTEDHFCRRCGAPALGHRAPAQTVEFEGFEDDAEEITRKAVGLNLVAAIAEKSLAMGRFQETERIVEKHLHAMLQLAIKGTTPSPEMLHRATGYALDLARGLDRGRWIDWIFQVHGAAGTLPQSAHVDSLHEVVRHIRYRDSRALRTYLETLGAHSTNLSAADKFVLKRLEGLERVISA